MKLVWIWDGRVSLPESRRKAVESALDLYPEAEAICITRNAHFVSDRVRIIPWDEILCPMLDRFGLRAVPYRWLEPVTYSDWARFWFLAHNPDTLYLDTDATVLKRLNLADKFLYPVGNIYALYAPPRFDGENLLHLMEERAKHNIGILIDFANKFSPEWASPLPLGFVEHHGRS